MWSKYLSTFLFSSNLKRFESDGSFLKIFGAKTTFKLIYDYLFGPPASWRVRRASSATGSGCSSAGLRQRGTDRIKPEQYIQERTVTDRYT